tara:strand:+ start:1137 stop:1415 length:279 start_codon:yes stop_codon:yes gene_type:complete
MSLKISIISEAIGRSKDPQVIEKYNKIIEELNQEHRVAQFKKDALHNEIRHIIDKAVMIDGFAPSVVMDILSQALEDEITFIEGTGGWLNDD